jgi:Tol biopolymer transport system component
MKKATLPLLILLLMACRFSDAATPTNPQVVPQEARWGIYRLALGTQETELLFRSEVEIASLRLINAGDKLVFSQKIDGEELTNEEIFTLGTDGSGLTRITDNSTWDLYPAWSPDGARIAFLSQRAGSLGIYVMNADGSNDQALYDSSAHEADIDWVGEQIVFTKDSSIWIMQSDGTGASQITNPPRAGEWGEANLPFGDYDPRISPDGTKVVFERLVDDQSPHGNYDFFLVELESTTEIQLTRSGSSQGLAQWSHSGNRLVYVVAAIGDEGQFDLYIMNSDGTGNQNITPAYFPPEFLCHWAVFSSDDRAIYFIGEWWPTE